MRASILLALLCLSTLTGCPHKGDERCHENRAEWYIERGELQSRWTVRDDCASKGTHCVTLDNLAFCAATPLPTPACSGAMACDGAALLDCRLGYEVGRQECYTACAESRCVPGATKDTRCIGRVSTCIDGAYVECEDGYPLTIGDCARDSRVCSTTERQPFALCVLDVAPDARCAAVNTGSVCQGALLLECYDGFLVGQQTCKGSCVIANDLSFPTGSCDQGAVGAPLGSTTYLPAR